MVKGPMLAWAPAESMVRVTQQAPPLPADIAYALSPLVVLLLLVSVLYAIQRRRHRRERAGTLVTLAFGAALGNALVELDAVFQPQRAQVTMVADLEEEPAEVGDGREPLRLVWSAPAEREAD